MSLAAADSAIATRLRAQAPWLFAPELGVCLVGGHALAIACARAGLAAPPTHDVDLAWVPDVATGQRLLEQHGVFMPTTASSMLRGTLAMRLGSGRVEITTLRNSIPTASIEGRIAADLAARDMTVGALALQLATGILHDPAGGLDHFRQRRIVPVGDVEERVREHPIRWLRYFRKAHEWGFELDRSVRNLETPPSMLDSLPREAVTGELRSLLLRCATPGRCLAELFEAGLLQHLAPELALQFDGRPAGPQRHHPELGQGLHMVLALEWAAEQSAALDERDRLTVMVAVLLHDLGKGVTPACELPHHPGHEHSGLQLLDTFLQRFPGLADPRSTTVARTVCELHVLVRHLRELRSGTLARLYDQHFRVKDFPVDLFALAVAADSGGRLGLASEGHRVREQVVADLHWLRSSCEGVDAQALRQQHPDLEAFRSALHQSRARAIEEHRGR